LWCEVINLSHSPPCFSFFSCFPLCHLCSFPTVRSSSTLTESSHHHHSQPPHPGGSPCGANFALLIRFSTHQTFFCTTSDSCHLPTYLPTYLPTTYSVWYLSIQTAYLPTYLPTAPPGPVLTRLTSTCISCMLSSVHLLSLWLPLANRSLTPAHLDLRLDCPVRYSTTTTITISTISRTLLTV
jgi:hypothetical protein